MNFLSRLPGSRPWWLALLVLCLALEGVALYYQYGLNQLPCVLCIHVRMLVFALILICVLALLIGQVRWLGLGLWVLATAVWIWMLERSYQLLGTERGWIMGECQMQSGLPEWLALERWMPWLFHIHEPCGYTPFVLFRITMAEILIVLSAVMVLFSLVALFAALGRKSS